MLLARALSLSPWRARPRQRRSSPRCTALRVRGAGTRTTLATLAPPTTAPLPSSSCQLGSCTWSLCTWRASLQRP